MKDQNIDSLLLSVVSGLDAMVVLMDVQSRFLFSNQKAIQLLGYKSQEEIFGITAFDMRCPAVKFAECFLMQNAVVQKEQKPYEYFDIHTYADGEPHIFLKKKSPFYQDGFLTGVLCFSTEIKSQAIQRITSEIIKKDSSFYSLPDGRSYVLTGIQSASFSERELECLFYLLRGYSAKETGKKLSLSSRTIETYLERIKNKTGLATKSQLIDYALSEGLINYIPRSILNLDISVGIF